MKASFKKTYASLDADRLVLLWLAVWWACNLLQAGLTELANDEAYYHMFAERLAWGYFDHPPVTALLVWAGERLFGGELGVRFFFTVLQPLYLWILWRLVRPADADRRDAALFTVVSASTLMLQLYGFIAVPDGPLMLTAALFLLTFKRFTEGRRMAWLWMGVAMALMAYSKYHGALVVLFALAAAPPRQLLRPSLYLSGAVALLLLVPHLVWQYDHDWASFAYHLSGRNSVFKPGYVVEFLGNMLVVFNLFFVPLYVQAWRKVKPQTTVGRALKLLPVAFIGFFLLSSLRGYVQPQWVIVSCFGLVYVLFDYARRHPRTRRYVMRAGGVTIALVALVRIEMIFNPLGVRFEVFDNRTSYGRIAQEAAGAPVIFDGQYTAAAKYAFYTGGQAYAQPSIYYRTSQYELRDDDDRMAGGPVLIQVWDSVPGSRDVQLPNGRTFRYLRCGRFVPVRRIAVETGSLPSEVRPGDTLRLSLTLRNPYPYDYRFDGDSVKVGIVWRNLSETTRRYDLPEVQGLLPAGGTLRREARFVVPELPERTWQVGFTVSNLPVTTWFNGPTERIRTIAK